MERQRVTVRMAGNRANNGDQSEILEREGERFRVERESIRVGLGWERESCIEENKWGYLFLIAVFLIIIKGFFVYFKSLGWGF